MSFKLFVAAVLGVAFLSGCGHMHKGGKCGGCSDCGSKTECSMDKDGKPCEGDCHKKPESK